jgi:hypothetical protein
MSGEASNAGTITDTGVLSRFLYLSRPSGAEASEKYPPEHGSLRKVTAMLMNVCLSYCH